MDKANDHKIQGGAPEQFACRRLILSGTSGGARRESVPKVFVLQYFRWIHKYTNDKNIYCRKDSYRKVIVVEYIVVVVSQIIRHQPYLFRVCPAN